VRCRFFNISMIRSFNGTWYWKGAQYETCTLHLSTVSETTNKISQG
jgi:hypothetical protein